MKEPMTVKQSEKIRRFLERTLTGTVPFRTPEQIRETLERIKERLPTDRKPFEGLKLDARFTPRRGGIRL